MLLLAVAVDRGSFVFYYLARNCKPRLLPVSQSNFAATRSTHWTTYVKVFFVPEVGPFDLKEEEVLFAHTHATHLGDSESTIEEEEEEDSNLMRGANSPESLPHQIKPKRPSSYRGPEHAHEQKIVLPLLLLPNIHSTKSDLKKSPLHVSCICRSKRILFPFHPPASI